ncbi:MAG: amidohydrolase [Bacteroidales bacterium]|nr:amidohydrolase [Bacteroidales bacterium]
MGAILLKNIELEGVATDVLIEGNLIAKVVQSDNQTVVPEGAEVVDCTGKALFPSFINMHTHAGMSLMKGIGEDMSFHQWIDRIWQVEKHLDEEYVYHATKAACLEMIKTGTTTFNDQYWHMPMAYKAAMELGLRPALSYVVLDQNDPEESERQKLQCQQMYELTKEWDDKAQLLISVHAIYSVREPMMLWAVDFARKHGIKIHIHVSETQKEVEDCMREHNGMSPVEYLDSLGVLGPDVIAAHTLWLSDNDVRILGERGVTCVHNINSNLKLASGYRFRYNELKAAGANVCLGTDGCGSSNNLDVLEAMKTSAIVQKAWREDPTAMPLDELSAMVNVNAAKALGINTGRIEEGALADLLIVNVDDYQFLSPAGFLANFVYSAHSHCIDSVICNGKFIMRGRVVEGEKEIIENARKHMNRLWIHE